MVADTGDWLVGPMTLQIHCYLDGVHLQWPDEPREKAKLETQDFDPVW